MSEIPIDVKFQIADNIRCIEEESFNEENIRNILLNLRDYISNNDLREFANFVHSERKSGTIHKSIYRNHCIQRGFFKFLDLKKKRIKFDPNSKIEEWEYDFFNFQLDTLSPRITYLRLGMSKKKAKIKLLSCFSKKKSGVRHIHKNKIGELEPIVKFLFSRLKAPKPTFFGEEIFNSLLQTLKDCRFNLNEKKFQDYKEEIILGFLILSNNKSFRLERDNNKIGKSYICFNYNRESKEIDSIDLNGISFVTNNKRLIFPIIETRINNTDLISNELIIRNKRIKGDWKKYRFDYESVLTLKKVEDSIIVSKKDEKSLEKYLK